MRSGPAACSATSSRRTCPRRLAPRPANLSSDPAPMDCTNIACVPAFTTKDGSEIRELLAHRNSCIRRQSLAQARLPPGTSTTPHYHPDTEEIYYILSG